MRSPALDALLRPMEVIRRVIWLAFIGTALLYVFVAYSISHGAAQSAASMLSYPLTLPLVIIAIVDAAAFPFVPRLLLPDRKFRDFITQDRDPETLARNPRTGQVDQTRLTRIKELSADERRQFLAASASFVPFVVQLAVAEAIVLYGLVLATVSHYWPAIVPFAIVTIALQLTISPRLDSYLERATILVPQ
jgi:hypothetical protein